MKPLRYISSSLRCQGGQTCMALTLTLPFTFLIAFLVSFFLSSTSVYAQDNTTEVNKIFDWAKQETPGCVCAVSQNGKVALNRAYGSADLERNVPLVTNSIFDIGSVRKQFIAAAVLLLVEEKQLSWTEDIHQYLPELPDYGQKITLNHLLTHTSGLRDWTGLTAHSHWPGHLPPRWCNHTLSAGQARESNRLRLQ